MLPGVSVWRLDHNSLQGLLHCTKPQNVVSFTPKYGRVELLNQGFDQMALVSGSGPTNRRRVATWYRAARASSGGILCTEPSLLERRVPGASCPSPNIPSQFLLCSGNAVVILPAIGMANFTQLSKSNSGRQGMVCEHQTKKDGIVLRLWGVLESTSTSQRASLPVPGWYQLEPHVC